MAPLNCITLLFIQLSFIFSEFRIVIDVLAYPFVIHHADFHARQEVYEHRTTLIR